MRDEAISDIEVHRAMASGRAVGSHRSGQAGSCPYPFRNPRLRQAWLEGFSDGRRQLRQKTGDASAVDAVPKRVTYTLDLRCPACGTTGIALASEIVSPRLGNIDFRLDTVPSGFHASQQGRALGDTVLVCTPCGRSAR